MNQSSVDHILSLFADFRSGDKDKIENADNELSELIKTPILGELCMIASEHEDSNIRYFSIVNIGRSLSIRKYEITQEEADLLKQFISEKIFNEVIDLNCEYLISIGCKLCTKDSNEEQSYLFKTQLIESAIQIAENKIHVALYFIYELIDSDILNRELFSNYNMAEICHRLILLGLQSEDDELSLTVHKRAIDLLHIIEVGDIYDNFLQSSEDILQILTTEAQFSIFSSTDDQESLKLFLFLRNIASDDPDALSESFDFHLKFTYEVIRNQEVPPIRREYALLFFDGAFLSQDDIFTNKLKDVLQITFDILRCKCAEEPETFQPCFSDRFLLDLSSDPDLTEEVYSTLMDISLSMKESEDVIGFRTSISCLGFISDNAQEYFESNSNKVCEIITYAINLEDQYVFYEVCNLIKLLCTYAFDSISPIFDELTVFLTKCLDIQLIDSALSCLDKLLDCSNRPPTNYSNYCSSLIEILSDQEHFPSDRNYYIIDCITSIIQKIDSTDENLYANIRPVLIEIIQKDPDTRSNVYRCYSSFSKIATRIVVDDIEPFANAMIEDLANSNQDLDLVFKIAESVSLIVEFIPQTFYPYASGFFEAFTGLFAQAQNYINQPVEIADDDNDDGYNEAVAEIVQIQKDCGQILNCISLLFAAYPTDLEGQFQSIYQSISDFLTSDETNLAIGAANSIRVISSFLSEQAEFSPNPIIDKVIEKIESIDIESEDDLVLLQALFNALATMSLDSGNKISDEAENTEKESKSLAKFYADCLSMNIHSIVDEKGKSIMNELQGYVMNALAAFIMGGAFNNSAGRSEIVKELIDILNKTRKRVFQSYAISSLARICFISPGTSEELSQVLIRAIQNLIFGKEKNITEKCINGYLFSLIFILSSQPELANSELLNLDQIRDYILANVNFDQEQQTAITQTSSLLLLLLCSMFQTEIDPSVLAHILQILPDPDDEGIPVYANCIFNMFNGNEAKFQEICNIGKIATTIILAPKCYHSMISQDAFVYFIEIVKQIPEDDLNSILEYNQSNLLTIKNIIS